MNKRIIAFIILIMMIFANVLAEKDQRFNYEVIRAGDAATEVRIRLELPYLEAGELVYSAVHAERVELRSVDKESTPNGLLFRLDTTQLSAAICVTQVDKTGACLGTLHLLFHMKNGEIRVEAVES